MKESIQKYSKNATDRAKTYVNDNPRRAVIIGGGIVLLVASFFIPVPEPHVSLSGEALFEGGPTWFTNSVLTTLVIDIVLILLAVSATRSMRIVPSGLQNLMEMLIEYLYNLAESVTGKAAATYFPWAATLFLFILLSNWSGLIPGVGSIGFFHTGAIHGEGEAEGHGALMDQQLALVDGSPVLVQAADALAQEATTEEVGAEEHGKFVPLFRAPSADLNVTFALALATMFMVQFHGVRALGGSYFKKFWNTSGHGAMKGINIFVSILELISELSRILTFAFRLFGNIFAGEVVLATMAFLIAFLVPLPFYILEILVGAVQALVFMMLCLAFFSMATISHSHGDEHH